MDGGGRRMNPAELPGLLELLRRQRISEQDFDIGDLPINIARGAHLSDFKLRKLVSEPLGKP